MPRECGRRPSKVSYGNKTTYPCLKYFIPPPPSTSRHFCLKYVTPNFTPLHPLQSFPRAFPSFPNALEVQVEAAAGGRLEGLLGGVVEAVVHQPATGRCTWVRARAHATHP
eukprot:scaffold102814_cov48-Phaeocystis_antarctica.AAC.1